MKITIIGGGAGGLFAALLLARAGHEVAVVERDRLQPGADVESAACSAYRATAPQIVQPHAVMARCRELFATGCPMSMRVCWRRAWSRCRSRTGCPAPWPIGPRGLAMSGYLR